MTKSARRAGFTLIEVLFASVLMSIVAAVVLYLSNTILTSWQGAAEKLSLDSEAQIVLDYMAQDLSGAYFKNNGETWLISSKADGNSLWLRFFTSAMDRDHSLPGDLNAVSYRLLPIEPLNGSATPDGLSSLYRTVIEAEKTFRDFQGKLESMDEDQFLDISEAEALGQSFLLGNIVSLEVKYFVRALNNNGEWELQQMAGPDLSFPNAGVVKPALAEISITVLSPEAARRLEAAAQGLGSALDANAVIQENGRTFFRQVALLGKPL